MKIFLRGMTTVEVMVMMVASTIAVMAASVALQQSFRSYHTLVHRDRALLFAVETLEQLEALRLTRMHQQYQRSWELFLGDLSDGYYRLQATSNVAELSLQKLRDEELDPRDTSMIREYDLGREGGDGFFTRLERRIQLKTLPHPFGGEQAKQVTVSAYWGEAGKYSEENLHQVRLQTLYEEQDRMAVSL